MPERDAISINLGDGYFIVAAGVRREKNGCLAADLMLENGRILFAHRAILNSEEGPFEWSSKATTEGGPTAERMAEAIPEYLLPEALKVLQEEPRKPSQADELVRLALETSDLAADAAADAELFHTPDHLAYATIAVGSHRETWPVRSRSFRLWLSRRFFEKWRRAPGSQAVTDAANLLEGKALFDGPEHPVYTRIAANGKTVYLDLADDLWQAVEIDADGWRIVVNPPVKFRRARGMLPLPIPRTDGDLGQLQSFVNVRSDDDWQLVLGWLIGAFRPCGPYAVLVVHGEQGSAKSTLSRVLRALIDPNEAPIRSTPRDERDLAIAASNGWCLAFDNVSHIPHWLSDAYCRLSTGGGFATRALYENDEETIFNSQRPIVLNGIDEIATRGDLLDRAIVIYLPAIPNRMRRTEQDIWTQFEDARPGLLGALLTAVSGALRHESSTVLKRKPRMADFARWVTAAESALGWNAGDFLAAYERNRQEANDLTLDASVVSAVVRDWAMELEEPWEGTATELLKRLDGRTDEKTRKLKAWPDSGRVLSNALRRLAPNLRATGVLLTFDGRRHGGRRVLKVERTSE